MATDETPYSQPDFFREQQDCEQGNSDQNQKCLELKRRCAAVARDDLHEDPNDEKITADKRYRNRGLQNRAGRINVDFTKSAAKVTHAQKQTTDKQANG